MRVADYLAAATASLQRALVPFAERVQETALEIIAGPGGALVLVLALLGVAVLAWDTAWLVAHLVRRVVAKRSPAPTPIARARGLASLGAEPAEIARAVGLPRDALTLVIPAHAARRPKVPGAAQTAGRNRPAESARPQVTEPVSVAVEGVSGIAAPPTAEARPLPSYHSKNANAPHFGEAA